MEAFTAPSRAGSVSEATLSRQTEPNPMIVSKGPRILARLARIAEQACQSSGISLPQYRLLDSLGSGPLRASEVAAFVGVSRPTLTSLVDGLVRRNFIVRRPVASDRRGIVLERTQEGSIALQHAEKALLGSLTALVEPEMRGQTDEVIAAVSRALDQRV